VVFHALPASDQCADSPLRAVDVGLLNTILTNLGLSAVPWLESDRMVLPSLAIMAAWKGVGYSMMILLAGLKAIPPHLTEASEVDGATGAQTFWNDCLWPLVVAQSNDMRTLTVGLATLQSLVPSTSSLMAAAAISFVPSIIVFILCQRYIVQSISVTGMKG